jgi:hypothetical protein
MWVQDNGAEEALPGHDWSPKQLFWIAAAQVSNVFVRALESWQEPHRARKSLGELSRASESSQEPQRAT